MGLAEKCEWSWLNRECRDPCPLERVALVDTSKIQILGVPLGSAEFAYEYVEGEVLPTAQKVMAKLAGFEDSQIAMYLFHCSSKPFHANYSIISMVEPRQEI